MRIIDSILRAGEGRLRKKLERIAADVNDFEDEIRRLSDESLAEKTTEFRERLAAGETEDDLLPEAFAVVREASRRVLGMRHFDVQIMGGAALHLGNIAEMRTGEGKTLVATLPSYLNALSGKGVHVITVNDYLAARDAEHMGKVHEFLGLSVGVVVTGQEFEERHAAYACDITYGTNNEFGFDYLRDNMATKAEFLVQRGHHFAVVDEVDSILIDEARTPLIISGPGDVDTDWYYEFARIAGRLVRDVDYDVEEKKHKVGLFACGVEKVESWIGVENLYSAEHATLVGYLNQAIRAKELFARDADYIVANGANGPEVMIVDEHTGRVLPGRRYAEGLHQALEAKEGVRVQAENQTLATITLQNYFRLYTKLSGMTGTGGSEAAEFHQTYGLGVVPIPANKTPRRSDNPDVVYRTEAGKFAAVIADIVERHKTGQPILVGTTSVEKSEHVSALLTAAGIEHRVLNAKNNEVEAHVIAQAGRYGAVTVATNMAGRGTDILLGGNADALAETLLVDALALGEHTEIEPVPVDAAPADDFVSDPRTLLDLPAGEALLDAPASRAAGEDAPESTDEDGAFGALIKRMRAEAAAEAKAIVAAEREKVAAAGGLYVLGTERHESRRIDNQLRGRAGRQGDPGETRFYLSLEDELMRQFAGGMLSRAMDTLGAGDMPIESKMVNSSVASAQGSMESHNHEIRKEVLKYDNVLSAQREVIYTERRLVLEGGDVSEEIRQMTEAVITSMVQALVDRDGSYPEAWDLDGFLAEVKEYIPVDLSVEELVEQATLGGELSDLTASALEAAIGAAAEMAYAVRETALGEDRMRDLERRVLLAVVDRKWRQHLFDMDYMRAGIGLRAFAQKDPLVEYQQEAYDMFLTLLDAIKAETVGYVFNVEVPPLTPTGPADEAVAVDLVDGLVGENTGGESVEVA